MEMEGRNCWRVIMLTYNLFSIKVRSFLGLFVFLDTDRAKNLIFVLFRFNSTWCWRFNFHKNQVSWFFAKKTDTAHWLCKVRSYSVVVGLGAKDLKRSVNPQCCCVILKFSCVLGSFLWLLPNKIKISHMPSAVLSLRSDLFWKVSRIGWG